MQRVGDASLGATTRAKTPQNEPSMWMVVLSSLMELALMTMRVRPEVAPTSSAKRAMDDAAVNAVATCLTVSVAFGLSEIAQANEFPMHTITREPNTAAICA